MRLSLQEMKELSELLSSIQGTLSPNMTSLLARLSLDVATTACEMACETACETACDTHQDAEDMAHASGTEVAVGKPVLFLHVMLVNDMLHV